MKYSNENENWFFQNIDSCLVTKFKKPEDGEEAINKFVSVRTSISYSFFPCIYQALIFLIVTNFNQWVMVCPSVPRIFYYDNTQLNS